MTNCSTCTGITSNALSVIINLQSDKLDMSTDKLFEILIEGVKEQQKQIKELDKKIHCLCGEINYMRNSNYSLL